MGRHRFGEGEYRYLGRTAPDAVDELRHALLPLPAAGRRTPGTPSWAAPHLGRTTLDEWLELCSTAAGRPKPTPLILKYGPGDWNALPPRPVRRSRLPTASGHQPQSTGCRLHRRRVRSRRAPPESAVAGDRDGDPPRMRIGVHHPRPAGWISPRLVGRIHPPRRVRDPLRAAFRPGPSLSRRHLTSWPPPTAPAPTGPPGSTR